MSVKSKIALNVPNSDNQNWYFSFRLKEDISVERVDYNMPPKILVVSDIEGNFQAFRRILQRCGVIDNNYKWIFDDGHLVIAGDCLDRGEHVIECLWLIYSLEEKARREGGHVHFILGNHEIMNLNGDWRYVHPSYATSTSVQNALYYGNSELWHWLCSKNIIEKIGNVLFVHGGISNALLNLNLSIHEINSIARSHYTKANELFSDPDLYILFNSEYSPFWYRGYYNQTSSEDLINATLKHFGVKTIVTGHTVVEKVTPLFKGKVINVDTDHASGNSEALLIKKNRYYRVDKGGKRERIK